MNYFYQIIHLVIFHNLGIKLYSISSDKIRKKEIELYMKKDPEITERLLLKAGNFYKIMLFDYFKILTIIFLIKYI